LRFSCGKHVWATPQGGPKKCFSVFSRLGAFFALAQVVSCAVSQIFDGGLIMPFSI